MVFDPYDLDLEVTPHSVRRQVRLREWAAAVMLAFRLNEEALKQEVLEAVPPDQGRSQTLPFFGGRGVGSLMVTSPCPVCPSGGGVQLTARCLCGEAAGLCGLQLGALGPPAVLLGLGPAAADATRPQTEEQVGAGASSAAIVQSVFAVPLIGMMFVWRTGRWPSYPCCSHYRRASRDMPTTCPNCE